MAAPQYSMPLTGEKHAPVFDPKQPRSLGRYFTNLESLFERASVTDDQQKKVFACRYVDFNVVDDWENLDEYQPGEATYAQFKRAVIKLYPGADETTKYTRAGLHQLVRDASTLGFPTLGDWAEFFRSFKTQTKWLIERQKISVIDQRRWCADAIGAENMRKLQTRLMLKEPDVHPSDGYSIAALDEAMRFQLQGTSLNPSRTSSATTGHSVPADTSALPGGVTIKSEDMSRLIDTLARLAPGSSATAPTTGGVPRASSSLPPATIPSCHYCNERGHGIGTCLAVEEDIKAGKCRRNPEGRVVLPPGIFVPRTLPGNSMRDRINEWHRRNPNQVVSGRLTYAPEEVYAPPEPLPSGSLLFEVQSTTAPTTASYQYIDDRARLETLEQEIAKIRQRAARFDGVNVPPLRYPRRPLPQPPAASPGPSERTKQAFRDRPPRLDTGDEEDGGAAQPQGAAEKGKGRPVPRVPSPTPPPAVVETEHPFASAPDATYLPPTDRNVGAPPPKAKEAPGRNLAPIEDAAVADRVLNRTLKSELKISTEELLAISPEVRAKLRSLVTSKRAAPAGSASQFLVAPVLPSVDELLNQEELPKGIIRVADPYELYLRSLPPGEEPRPLTVARESHALRVVQSTIGDREIEVDCLLDPGSQVVSCSEAVCHALGLSYDPSIVLNMQSANGEVDPTLGLARNVPFRLGDITLYFQVHVVRQAAYDLLMGRPFDVLTASIVRNYNNAEQTVTIHCPNTGRVTTIPTLPRRPPQFRMPAKGF